MKAKNLFFLSILTVLIVLVLSTSAATIDQVNAQDQAQQSPATSNNCVALSDVQISGPTGGFTGLVYLYTANIDPAEASTPISYVWSPEPLSGQGTKQVSYSWNQSRDHTISVTVSNCGGKNVNTDNHMIFISRFIDKGVDSDNDGIVDMMEYLMCTSATNPDSDRDALKDGWEVLGLRFEDGDFIDLPSMGANPCQKDVFLQLDWEEGVAFTEEQLQTAVNIFRTHDVTLHISGKERPIYDTNDDGESDLDAHSAVQKIDADGDYYFNPKLFWTHIYGYAHYSHGRSTGWHNWLTIDMLVKDRTYRLIHELGHTLGLGHGGHIGSDDQVIGEKGILYYDGGWISTNYKPNYLSIMNYRYSGSNVCYNASTDSWLKDLDYTTKTLPTLDESDLDERPLTEFSSAILSRHCIGQPGYVPVFTYSCLDPDDGKKYQMISDGLQTLARKKRGDDDWQTTNLPPHPPGIDWNCDGSISSSVSSAINECFWCSAKNDWDTDEILTAPGDWDFVPAGLSCHIYWSDKLCGWRPSNPEYQELVDGVYCEQTACKEGQSETENVNPFDPHEDEVEELIIDDLPNLEMCDGEDNDGDGSIDEGCLDTDQDGVNDAIDNCPETFNPNQRDLDKNKLGDACQEPVITAIYLENGESNKPRISWEGTMTDILGFNVYGKNHNQDTITFLGSSYPTTTNTFFTDLVSGDAWDVYYVRPVNLNGQEGEAVSLVVQANRFYYLPLISKD